MSGGIGPPTPKRLCGDRFGFNVHARRCHRGQLVVGRIFLIERFFQDRSDIGTADLYAAMS